MGKVNGDRRVKIAVVGTGYVGLTTGACFASLGHDVVCADIDADKIAKLRDGEIPIVEPGLAQLVRDGVEQGRLSFMVGAAAAAWDCDFAFMCLPTPQGEDGSADLSYLFAAAREIAPVLPASAVVVNKSTVPVGSADQVAAELGRPDIEVASNPEFLREGQAIADFLHPDRIVVGAGSHDIARRVMSLYDRVKAPKLLVSTATAELIKYASNAYLAAKISFANSISTLCEAVGANAHEVLQGMGLDHRIGGQFLRPGPGWGGSCFPKDTYALINIADNAGYDFDLLRSVIRANEIQTAAMADKVAELLGGRVAGAVIAAWGLAFKAGTDDTRQSPALAILERLHEQGAVIRAYDPAVTQFPDWIEPASDALAACDGADILAVLTEWPQFAEIPLEQVGARLRSRRLLDTRNIMDLNRLRELWFSYHSVGNYQPYTLIDA